MGQQVGEALRGHEGWVYSVAFSPDGTRTVSGSSDKTIRVWDAATGQQVGEALRGHENQVCSVAFSPDGTHIVSGSLDKTIRVWDAVTGQQVGEALRGHEDWVWSVAFSPDSTRIVSGSDDKTIRVWDAAMGQGQVNPHLTCPQHHSDWFCFSKKETESYILWIPRSLRHRDFIWYPCNMVLTVGPKIAVQFGEAAWGPDWAKIKK
ncbi:WD40 repeat-like protein [Tricholoma matsutake]|nr:WD40 repeat-like protein [Tricholoma matsutake 945]